MNGSTKMAALVLILVIAMALLFAGCSKKDTESPAKKPDYTKTTADCTADCKGKKTSECCKDCCKGNYVWTPEKCICQNE